MKNRKECRGCGSEDKCREMYEKLGQSGNAPIGTKVAIALLLPLIIFIIVLVVSKQYLGAVIANDDICTLAAFLIAAGMVCLFGFTMKLFSRKPSIEKRNEHDS